MITNNTETLVFEFIVKQITSKPEENSEKIKIHRLAPLKQIANGISPKDIICNENLQLVFKITDDNPACVKLTTMEKLIERNWVKS